MGQTLKTETEAILKRLNRIEGQVRGIGRMMEEERYCIDVLQQVQAVKAALAKVEDAILTDHAATCIESAILAGNAGEQREKFTELVALFSKTKR
jgi:DNA-binding FrmR family transcriptional regulator